MPTTAVCAGGGGIQLGRGFFEASGKLSPSQSSMLQGICCACNRPGLHDAYCTTHTHADTTRTNNNEQRTDHPARPFTTVKFIALNYYPVRRRRGSVVILCYL